MARTRTQAEPNPVVEPPLPAAARLGDAGLVAVFLGLTFLLGLFPLRDTDFWWHLRTGDLIRQTWQVPNIDPYTFGAEGHRWIDLHWLFQVGVSWVYQHGGVPALNLVKAAITSLAVLLLVWPPRRDWPVWPILLAWLPALYVLSGRMYVRPETLTLLYLAADLAILARWDRRPRLAYLLPVVQVLWVNTQGLFVFGPMLVAFALADAALSPGAFAPSRRAWWRTALIASALTGAVCLLNPYGLLGALYPLELLGTMADPIFRRTIAELQPVGDFIADAGLHNFQIRIYLLAAVLGALSFLVPLVWQVATRVVRKPELVAEPPKGRRRKGKATVTKRDVPPAGWRLRPFRLLLFFLFWTLSWQATRNSHQFAAVVGTVTGWNIGEWAAVMRRRRVEREGIEPSGLVPRLATLGILLAAIGVVGSGQLYRWAGEGRTVGLGEEPLWFPKAAVAFAGREGMPERFVCFHNGHAALFEYQHAPARKVYTDARLEVMGAELYGQYIDLQGRIAGRTPGWEEQLAALGNPGMLVDNVQSKSAGVVASLLASPAYRCVWFDPIAAVFVPRSAAPGVPTVDFAARHFRPDPATDPRGPTALVASARVLSNVAALLMSRRRADLAGPLTLCGIGHAHRALAITPADAEAWKRLGQLMWQREPAPESAEPIPRFRLPFDPVFDLVAVRTTYALRRALEGSGDDFTTLVSLILAYRVRGMDEAALPLLERLAALPTVNADQAEMQSQWVGTQLVELRAKLGPLPRTDWKNMSELSSRLDARLAAGRAESAAELLASAYARPESRPWDVSDRLATLWLHLGRPDRAHAAWLAAADPPRPALREARVAVTYLAEEDHEAARRRLAEALRLQPDLFEAEYVLAVLERDAGRAEAALDAARRAVEHATSEVAADAARRIVAEVEPYAGG